MVVFIVALHFVKQKKTFTDFKKSNTSQSNSFLIWLEQIKVETKFIRCDDFFFVETSFNWGNEFIRYINVWIICLIAATFAGYSDVGFFFCKYELKSQMCVCHCTPFTQWHSVGEVWASLGLGKRRYAPDKRSRTDWRTDKTDHYKAPTEWGPNWKVKLTLKKV